MTRISLSSRLIDSVDYNSDTMTLHVWLKSHRHVTHPNVPPAVFETLVGAESPGFYYSYYIAANDERVPRPITWVYKLAGTVVAAALLFVPG